MNSNHLYFICIFTGKNIKVLFCLSIKVRYWKNMLCDYPILSKLDYVYLIWQDILIQQFVIFVKPCFGLLEKIFFLMYILHNIYTYHTLYQKTESKQVMNTYLHECTINPNSTRLITWLVLFKKTTIHTE